MCLNMHTSISTVLSTVHIANYALLCAIFEGVMLSQIKKFYCALTGNDSLKN